MNITLTDKESANLLKALSRHEDTQEAYVLLLSKLGLDMDEVRAEVQDYFGEVMSGELRKDVVRRLAERAANPQAYMVAEIYERTRTTQRVLELNPMVREAAMEYLESLKVAQIFSYTWADLNECREWVGLEPLTPTYGEKIDG